MGRMSLSSLLKLTTVLCQQRYILIFFILFLMLLLTVLQVSPNTYLTRTEDAPDHCGNNTGQRTWPLIIHQTWKDRDVPEKYHSMQEHCRATNPEYEYRLWTDSDLEELIRDHYGWFLETWHSYPYNIQRIDSARLFVIHHHGGVYLDLDIHCKVALSELKKDALTASSDGIDVILAETEPLGITNNFIMAQPRASFMDFITHRLLETKGRYFSPHWTVMFTAGPLFVYKTYLNYPCKRQVHLISQHDHSEVYFTHIQERTWHSWDGPFITWFDYHGRTLMKVTAVLIIAILVKVYWRTIADCCHAVTTMQKTPLSPTPVAPHKGSGLIVESVRTYSNGGPNVIIKNT